MVNEEDYAQLALEAGNVFRHASPIDEASLFAGRIGQIRQAIDAIFQPGQHAIIYGERGVGKTSLANILSGILEGRKVRVLAPRVNCDSADTYTSLWQKVFSDIEIISESRAAGFTGEETIQLELLTDELPDVITTNDVRRLLTKLSHKTIFIITLDELDRLPHGEVRSLLADTIKVLSDHSVPATLILVGVADSVDELIAEHQSVERALIQILMPRMSVDELHEIINKGLERLTMEIEDDALRHISLLSQGFPHYTHLIGLYATREALDENTKTIQLKHVAQAIRSAIEKSHQSILNNYIKAIRSSRRESLFKQVLLACALAEKDPLGFFTASAVRKPMSLIMGKMFDIPSFSRHLKEFCEEVRGSILNKTGGVRRVRFRFSHPLMQPHITMHGFADGLINMETLEKLWPTKAAS